jgi:hypothetical protein
MAYIYKSAELRNRRRENALIIVILISVIVACVLAFASAIDNLRRYDSDKPAFGSIACFQAQEQFMNSPINTGVESHYTPLEKQLKAICK